MKLNTRIFLGFVVIIILILFLVGINYNLNESRLDKTNQIKDVESPLDLMVEQVIGYDAILTESAQSALLHSEEGQFSEVQEDIDRYNVIGSKLDSLLKIEARNLLEKSKRSPEIRQEVDSILKRLDEVNLLLVDLETTTFNAIKNNNTLEARDILSGEEYEKNKDELAKLYNAWADLEKNVSSSIRAQIILQSNQLRYYNLIFAGLILILAILLSFLISFSISKPLKKLKIDVDEISKGKLDIQLEKSNIYEIQSLTDSLNRILATMKLAILRTGLNKAELGLNEAVKAKEEAEIKYKLLYETSSDAIMTLEPPNWNFTAGNPATLKIFNLNDEQKLTTLTPGDLSPPTQPDGQKSNIKAKKMIEKALKEGKAFFEWTHKRYHGGNFPAEVLLTKVQEDGKVYLQATVRDLTLQDLKKDNKGKK